jgi:hypothetical protein
MFDTCGVLLFSGAKVDSIPSVSRVRDPIDAKTGARCRSANDGQWRNVPPPIAVEEAENGYNNNVWTVPSWNSGDRLGTWHPGNSANCAGIDGSVVHVTHRTTEGAWSERMMSVLGDWTVFTPKGSRTDFAYYAWGADGFGWFSNN